MTIREP